MFSRFSRKKRSTLLSALLIVLAINAFGPQSAILGIFLAISLIGLAGSLCGPFFLPARPAWMQTVTGSTIFISALSLTGSVIYYVGNVSQLSLVLTVVVLSVTSTLLGKQSETVNEETTHQKPLPAVVLALGGVLIAITSWWSAILTTQVFESIRSPWEQLDPTIIVAIVVATIFTAVITRAARGRAVAFPLIAATFFSIIAIGFTLYPLGYGFDPFIHRATVAHIAEHGTITPKPLYYIGQYALELISVHVFALPLQLVDRLLVPVLATLLLTGSAAIGFRVMLKKDGETALLALLLLPLASFIVTTPQSLAYAFTGAMLLLSLPRLQGNPKTPLHTLGILGVTALVIHPLAGIPALIYFAFLLILALPVQTKGVKLSILGLAAIAGSVALPLVFILQAQSAGLAVTIEPANLFELSRLQLEGFLANRNNTWLDGLYLFISNQLWILLLLAVMGAWTAIKHGANKQLLLPLLAVAVWLINFWILGTALEFEFLIEYERANYANRLIVIASLFALPLAGVAIAGAYNQLKTKPKALSVGLTIVLGLMVGANAYGTYPRHDNYARSSGFNVANVDVDAVYAIDDLGGDQDYIVLANQAVSAAALESFGFKTYYKNDIFYYPIPTGGELYNSFLEMTENEPTRDAAYEAMDLAGVDLAFFVVNEYWWQSEKIREHAKLEADDWFSVGDGAVTVFIYDRSPNEAS